MKAKPRLALAGLMIVVSAFYGALILADDGIAAAFALGYVSFLLTVFVANEVWRDYE